MCIFHTHVNFFRLSSSIFDVVLSAHPLLVGLDSRDPTLANMDPSADKNDPADKQSEFASSTRSRADRSQLLTKIYYPDTLYPDTYSFFTDRSTAMDPSDSNPDATTIPKPATTELELIERQTSYAVS